MVATKQTRVRAEADGIVGDAIFDISERCLACRFLRNPPLTCDAFIEGIPQEILSGKFDHKEEFEGDNGITFKKK